MYCAVEEAFDNPLRQQMQRINRENKINNHKASLTRGIENFQQKNGLTPPHIIEGYINERIYPTADLPFFTTQGDYNIDLDSDQSINTIKGTTLSELQRQEDDSFFDDSNSLLDSNYSDLLANNESESKAKLGHNFCINKFLKSIADDRSDIISLASSQDGQVYDHIRSCKYCRNQINQKMKKIYQNKTEGFSQTEQQQEISKQTNQPSLDLPDKIFGYKVKEIIIIITVSIMLIFILDLLVRVGRKTMK